MFTPQYNVVSDQKFYTVERMRKVTVPVNWKNLVEEQSELNTQGKFTLAKDWNHKKSSRNILPREAWQEDSPEPGPQDLPPGSDPQATPIGITEDCVSLKEM